MNKRRKIDGDASYVITDSKATTGESENLIFSACSCLGPKIEAATPPVEHSEAPHWDETNQVLYFVDTFKATVHRFDPSYKDKWMTRQEIEGSNSVGIIVPVKDNEHTFAVAADRYVYELKWNPKESHTGHLKQIYEVDEDKPYNQFNDGKADANGRLWIGTLTREEDLSVTPYGGTLYRFDTASKVTRHIENVSISNGLAWSSDNTRFFYSDSETKKIMEYEFELETGRLGFSRVLFNLMDHPELEGIADGLTIDNKDNLWIALFGGHGIINVNGSTGELIKFIKMPATYCTSACFGGPDKEILYVTTSKLKLNEFQKSKEPNAGAVFSVKNLGVTGATIYECVLT